MLLYQKNIFDRYYCISLFCCLITIRRTKSVKDEYVFKNASSRAKIYAILMLCPLLCTLLLITSIFVTAPVCVHVKSKSHAIALLIHWFVSAKHDCFTACDTAFYAILRDKTCLRPILFAFSLLLNASFHN